MPSPYRLRAVFLTVFLLLSLHSPVFANRLSAVVSASTNYFYRGYSKTGNEPSGRINVDYEHQSGVYLGTWISRVKFNNNRLSDLPNLEFYPYLGFNFKLAENWRSEVLVSRYLYDGKFYGRSLDYTEYGWQVHFSDLLTFSTAFANNAYNRGQDAWNYEATGRYPLLQNLELSAAVGYNNASPLAYSANGRLYETGNPPNKYQTLYWNIGASWYIKNWALDFRYVDASYNSFNNVNARTSLAPLNTHFVFTVSVGF